MRFFSYFSVAFLFNLGLLAVLGMLVDQPLWGDLPRFLGCVEYAVVVAAVFALLGRRTNSSTDALDQNPADEPTAAHA